jgi:hypothetical protein
MAAYSGLAFEKGTLDAIEERGHVDEVHSDVPRH